MVAFTGQVDLERMHKESHQYIDILGSMRPITKWNARLNDPAIIPEVVRKAFKVAQREKPGPTHIEIPEDVMAARVRRRAVAVERRGAAGTGRRARSLRAAELIREAQPPIVLAGNGVVRVGAAPALREFVEATGIPVAETFMGKGLVDAEDAKALGAVGLQAGDYDDGRLRRGRRGDRRRLRPRGALARALEPRTRQADRLHRLRCRPRSTSTSSPKSSWSANHAHAHRLADECPARAHRRRLLAPARRGAGSLEAGQGRRRFPMQPPRALFEIRQALGARTC